MQTIMKYNVWSFSDAVLHPYLICFLVEELSSYTDERNGYCGEYTSAVLFYCEAG